MKVLDSFHHQAVWMIAGRTARHTEVGEWEYPPVVDALKAAGIWPIKEYIQIWKTTIAAQVACRPIYDICTGAEKMPGSSRLMMRWDQDVGRKEE